MPRKRRSRRRPAKRTTRNIGNTGNISSNRVGRRYAVLSRVNWERVNTVLSLVRTVVTIVSTMGGDSGPS